MGIDDRPWCDFVIYTNKEVSVQRIAFNEDIWNNKLLPKLTSFYDNCTAVLTQGVFHVGLNPTEGVLTACTRTRCAGRHPPREWQLLQRHNMGSPFAGRCLQRQTCTSCLYTRPSLLNCLLKKTMKSDNSP